MNMKQLEKKDITIDLFNGYKRRQVVDKCWRLIDGEWVLKSDPFIDEWSEEEYEFLCTCLIATLEKGGVVYAGLDSEDRLLGFSSVEGEIFGKNKEYVQLSSIHISEQARGKGLGKKLFQQAIESGRELGAKKLYISAHSAEETIAFYKKMGCRFTTEINYDILENEPYDVQLEYVL